MNLKRDTIAIYDLSLIMAPQGKSDDQQIGGGRD